MKGVFCGDGTGLKMGINLKDKIVFRVYFLAPVIAIREEGQFESDILKTENPPYPL